MRVICMAGAYTRLFPWPPPGTARARTSKQTEERLAECLDDRTIAAMVDGTLSPAERAGVEAHLDWCAECYEVFASAARFLAEEEPSVEARPPARPARDVPVIAAAVVILLAMACALFLLLAAARH
jgi:anti-sigma factor RsiW